MNKNGPMDHLDDWEECVAARYPAGASIPAPDSNTSTGAFRDYSQNVRPAIREFYRLNHRNQTMDFVQAKKRQYLPLRKRCGMRERSPFASGPPGDLSFPNYVMSRVAWNGANDHYGLIRHRGAP